jgi:hypothetical protein
MLVALVAGLLATGTPQQGDTATFSDAATAELYARARVRHIRQDALVRDYRALVETRIDWTAGRSRFARQIALMASETLARVTWQVPNDLRVEVLGTRAAAPVFRMVAGLGGDAASGAEEAEQAFGRELPYDRPWFIPRSLGDSVHLMGIPERAALHPLASNALDHYRFEITDSVRISVPGRDVRAVKMRVEPKRLGPSLVAGDMWIDQDTGDVVRLMVVFVGEFLWEDVRGDTPKDSAEARNDNKWATRFLSVEADVEYALIENRYWLPHRQLLALIVRIPWFSNSTMPVRFVSKFTDYEVNTAPDFAFAVPLDTPSAPATDEDADDRAGERSNKRLRVAAGRASEQVGTKEEQIQNGYFKVGTWGDGRWEMEVPPADTLWTYAWDTDFKVALDQDEEEHFREALVSLAKISEQLPGEWVGRSQYGLAWERFSDIVRFNRVQGPSLGLGYQWRPGPEFTTVLTTARFGISDLRPTASVMWRRDGPGGRLDLSAYRTVHEAEPWTSGLGVGNSLNATFTGHDDADYHLALGGGLSYQWNAGALRDIQFSAQVESHRSMRTEVSGTLPSLFGADGLRPNPPVTEGTFLRIGLSRPIAVGPVTLHPGGELLAGDSVRTGRVWGSLSLPFAVLRRTGALTLRAGAARGDNLSQLAFRLGGPFTVRGHPYGARLAREFWSAQLDVAVARSQLWAPVVFVDVGDTFSSDPMVGAGAGMSLLNGLLRFNFSKGIRPSAAVRFDLAFRASR